MTNFDRVIDDLLEFVGYDGCPEIRSAILLYRDVVKDGEHADPLAAKETKHPHNTQPPSAYSKE